MLIIVIITVALYDELRVWSYQAMAMMTGIVAPNRQTGKEVTLNSSDATGDKGDCVPVSATSHEILIAT
jgi:hypothetical protein